ncbi:hypothetical protein DO021_14330 [Desulfobacter hydrogenophilus]|uniref:Zeta toxin domain-containing protein n=1 Tax=Desulfobacter hydrogenophilus TaxID=2291 RepID=A0A328F9F7_9BACT|nr:zeta toxin family protein [Desulfobacter hydrogenophilus]RAM01251.1 hypothetical protein DO021_14330 [Desulfobacter hydrogenophilus]
MNFIDRINKWREVGYEVILYFLYLPNAELAVRRVKLRVAQGGHNVPENVISRRYRRGWDNFQKHYKQIVDDWIIFDNSGDQPLIMEEKR